MGILNEKRCKRLKTLTTLYNDKLIFILILV